MPFSGSTFTKLFNWATDWIANSKIFNARLDAEFDGIATGLTSLASSVLTGSVGDFLIGTTSNTPKMLFYGDSLTAGLGATNPPSFYVTMPTYNGLSVTVVTAGTPGYTIRNLSADVYIRVHPNYSQNAGFNCVLVWGGVNDLAVDLVSPAQAFAHLEQLCRHLRLCGWRVIVGTLVSLSGHDTDRATFNTYVRSTWPRFADEIADFGADATLGVAGAYSNATYFQAGGIHLTDAGNTIIGGIMQAAITKAITSNLQYASAKQYFIDYGGATVTAGQKSGLQFVKSSATASDGNEIIFSGEDTAIARCASIGIDYTAGSLTPGSGFTGDLYLATKTTTGATAPTKRIGVKDDGGVMVPPTVTGGSKGAGTINATEIYRNGTVLATVATSASASDLSSGTLPAGRLPALTGDVTSSAGSAATTLAAGNAGNLNSGTLLAARMPALTGDITTSAGAVATALATVNSNVGTFGSATQASQVTVNGKGLVTAAANITVTPAVGSITGFGTGVGAWLATPSSANLAAAVTDETGSGALVFGTAPTIAGGTHTAITSLGIRSTGAAFDLKLATIDVLTADRTLTIQLNNVNRNLNMGGDVTFNSAISFTTIAQGDLLYGSAAATVISLAKDTGTSRFLKNSGTNNNPAWAQPAFTDLSGGTAPAFTLGGTVSGGGNQINNVIIGTSTPLAGSFTTMTASGLATGHGLSSQTLPTTTVAVLDASVGCSITHASGAQNTAILSSNYYGMIIVSDATVMGNMAILLLGNGAYSIVAELGTASWVAATTTPGSNKYSLNCSAGAWKFYSNSTGSPTMVFCTLRTN